ncbi:hypothetical protein PN499_10600 [Kamptonema animale CS-326]|jgi:hypothetical protein|uniref:DUF6745 domain-containing protein n=1 Tax=Kamptonema animale TaxID=92934 RepID=UPI00232ABB1E|nr:hypothetical protein [Kamptonema animale]MDB9511632.1 hypothetical protein [Kamptonema animale CS-326]
MIDKLTLEQEALMVIYREKWKAIARSTEPIDRDKAADTVKAIYAALGQQEPKITFFDSPYAALKSISLLDSLPSFQGDSMDMALRKILDSYRRHLKGKLFGKVWIFFQTGFLREISDKLSSQIAEEKITIPQISGLITLQQNRDLSSRIDYFLSGLSIYCQENQYKWELYLSLAANCGWIYGFEEICYVCDRPRIMSLDSEEQLHAEGVPAVQFADGFSVYAYHGVILPEKYGKVHPQQWRSEWLLSEDNGQLRRALIEGIGYERICQESAAVELDSWQEYTLLKIDIYENFGYRIPLSWPIYLLKRTCPSTGYIQVLRVLPFPSSAREAIQSLVNNCCWTYTPEFKDICYVCDRPRIISFDSQGQLHAEGSPAIQLTDGFTVYAYHGVSLPEKYGKFHPQEWRSEWLLSEDNAEIRRVLIQGIGYDRICQELAAVELDTWQEYTLLKIDNNVDFEKIYLLKMTCPSTGNIHILRVPPDVSSAREAIRWVNWGIDPEEFAVQT